MAQLPGRGRARSDIFFLLPDFSGDKGNVLRTIIDWIRDVWEVLDEEFLKRWNEWAAPVISGVGNVINQISGGVAREIGTMLQELAELIKDAILGLLTKLYDWFGLLTSGVPKGWGIRAFTGLTCSITERRLSLLASCTRTRPPNNIKPSPSAG